MKRVGKPWLFVIIVLILALAFTSFFGVYGTWGDLEKTYIRGAKDIRWGTDIQGGVSVTFGPADGIDTSDEQINILKDVLENRLVNNNITDYEIYVDEGEDRVILSFPWKDSSEAHNAQDTISELSASAEVLFIDGNPETVYVAYDAEGNEHFLDGNGSELVVSVRGKHIEEATYGYTQANATSPVVLLVLNDEGKDVFAEATRRQYGNYISIWLNTNDGVQFISCPQVNAVITDGQAEISGSFTLESAKLLANQINDGALPFKIDVIDYEIVDPALGKDSLSAMLIAGIIAFVAIALFMIAKYRLPGTVAVFALLGQVAATIAIVSGYFPAIKSFTLTIPGIAGIILSIGMQVDANIITSERIKEELAKGKSLEAAVDSGSDESVSAIVDGNITNMIVAIILMGVFGPTNQLWSKILTPFLFMFGPATTGSIYSFGCTMFAGALLNLVFGLFATKIMLRSATKFSIFRKKALYGGVE